MSKSARIATRSSPASRSSLTPPAASSASPRNTPTPPLKWKPQKQAPPRSRFPWEHVSILQPSAEDGLRSPSSLTTANSYGTVIPDCPSFFSQISSRCSQKLVPLLLSLCLCVFFFSFKFQLSTFNFPPLPARVQ